VQEQPAPAAQTPRAPAVEDPQADHRQDGSHEEHNAGLAYPRSHVTPASAIGSATARILILLQSMIGSFSLPAAFCT
jgi:hypothetical protein